MAIKTRFYLRASDKKSEKDSTIFCRLTNGRKTDIRINTGLAIKPKYWDFKADRPKDNALYTDEEKAGVDFVNECLKGIDNVLSIGLNNNEIYLKEDALADIEKYKSSKEIKEKDKPQDILPFLDIIIQEMKSGELLYKSKPFSPNTIKVWNSFRKVLSKFLSLNRGITWDKIDQSMFDKFVGFLTGEGYTTSTSNKYIITFNALLNHGYKRKQHRNRNITDDFYKIPETDTSKTKAIYLTSEELDALYEMPLEEGSTKCKVRDIFLCGCYTAQRISDYGRLSEENFTTTSKGNDVVKLVQTKGGNRRNTITIPVLNDNLLKIAKKYNYDIPRLTDQTINEYIKEICKELSETVPSLLKKEKTLLTMKERAKEKSGKIKYERDSKGNVFKPRYDMVATHTARRSAITNLYLTGLFDTYQLMSISGHRSEKTFRKYLCMSSEEIADGIAETLRQLKKKKQEDLF